jgi:hypothetical protein
MFPSRMVSQVRHQLGGRSLDLRFVQHVAVAPPTFDDIEFTGYYAAPAELRVKIPADRAEAASKEYNSTIVRLWPVSPAHVIQHVRRLPQHWTKELHAGPRQPRPSRLRVPDVSESFEEIGRQVTKF